MIQHFRTPFSINLALKGTSVISQHFFCHVDSINSWQGYYSYPIVTLEGWYTVIPWRETDVKRSLPHTIIVRIRSASCLVHFSSSNSCQTGTSLELHNYQHFILDSGVARFRRAILQARLNFQSEERNMSFDPSSIILISFRTIQTISNKWENRG